MYKRDRKTSFKKIGARTLNTNHSMNNQQFYSSSPLRRKKSEKQQAQPRESNKNEEEKFIHNYINEIESQMPYFNSPRTYNDEDDIIAEHGSTLVIQQLKKEIEKRGQSLLECKRNFENFAEVCKALKNEKNQIKEEQKQLQNTVFLLTEENKTNNIRIKDLLSRIQAMKEENGHLSKRASGSFNDKNKIVKLDQKLSKLKKDLLMNETKLTEQEKYMSQIMTENKKQKRIIAERREEDESLKNDFILLKQKYKNLQKMLAIVQDDLKRAQNQIIELSDVHEVNERLELQLNKVSKEKQVISRKHKLHKEMSGLKIKEQNMSEEIKHLRKQYKSKKVKDDKTSQKKLTKKDMEESSKMKTKLKEYRKYDDIIEEYKKKFDPVIIEVDQLETFKEHNADLLQEIAQLKADRKMMISSNQTWVEDKQKLTKNIQELKNQIAQQKIKQEELQQVGLQQTVEIRGLQKENEVLTQKKSESEKMHMGTDLLVSQLNEKIGQYEEEKKKMAGELLELPQLKEKNEKLDKLLKEIQGQLTEINPEELKSNMKKLQENEKVLFKLIDQFEYTEVNPPIHKLQINKKSLLVNLSCKKCLKTLENASTLEPCGHTFCFKCINSTKTVECPECEVNITGCFKNQLVQDILPQIQYKMELIKSLEIKRSENETKVEEIEET